MLYNNMVCDGFNIVNDTQIHILKQLKLFKIVGLHHLQLVE